MGEIMCSDIFQLCFMCLFKKTGLLRKDVYNVYDLWMLWMNLKVTLYYSLAQIL